MSILAAALPGGVPPPGRRLFSWEALGVVDGSIDQNRLIQVLPAWVPAARYLAECDSTNRVAMQWAKDGALHGSLLLADYQSSGRGRLNRSWVAPAGSSLLFSIVLRPSFGAERWALVGMAAGVAGCRRLREQGIGASLKWPNDVVVDGRKVAGILVESERGALVLGVGINVNVSEFPLPLQGTATSMSLAAGRRFDRLQVLGGVLEEFGPLYEALPYGLIDSYRPLCDTLGARVKVECSGESVEDVAEDVDASGALVLARGKVVSAGEVVHLRTSV